VLCLRVHDVFAEALSESACLSSSVSVYLGFEMLKIVMVVTNCPCRVGQINGRNSEQASACDGTSCANVALINSVIASPDTIGERQWQNRQNQPSSRFWC
jgi:hypothetical protein